MPFDSTVVGTVLGPLRTTLMPAGSMGYAAGCGHVYTACARQANSVSIHTDTAVAKREGPPAPILMGTAAPV